MGFKGGCIPCTSPADAPYFDDVYEPIWARAEEAGFPLSMHVGCSAYVPKERRNTAHRPDAIADYAATQGTVQRTIVEFMCRGVCERHPKLKIVSPSSTPAGSRTGWTVSTRVYNANAATWTSRSPGRPPHEVWRRQFYATIEDDRPALATRELIGLDNLMWGSDYPHTDSTWPCSNDVLDELFEGIDETHRAKITRDNVKALYGV